MAVPCRAYGEAAVAKALQGALGAVEVHAEVVGLRELKGAGVQVAHPLARDERGAQPRCARTFAFRCAGCSTERIQARESWSRGCDVGPYHCYQYFGLSPCAVEWSAAASCGTRVGTLRNPLTISLSF